MASQLDKLQERKLAAIAGLANHVFAQLRHDLIAPGTTRANDQFFHYAGLVSVIDIIADDIKTQYGADIARPNPQCDPAILKATYQMRFKPHELADWSASELLYDHLALQRLPAMMDAASAGNLVGQLGGANPVRQVLHDRFLKPALDAAKANTREGL